MSSRALRRVLIAFSVAGVLLAGYLTYVHYAGIKPVCTAGGSCAKVQTSTYSLLLGVPVALLGLLTYVGLLGLLLGPDNETTRFLSMALTVVGFAFSAYLTYREIYSIHAICEECATSAGFLTVMTPLAIWRFLSGQPEQPPGKLAAAGPSGEESAAPAA